MDELARSPALHADGFESSRSAPSPPSSSERSTSTSSRNGSAMTSARFSCRCSTSTLANLGTASSPHSASTRRDLRIGARARTHRRPLLLRPLRRAAAQTRQHRREAALDLVNSAQQQLVRASTSTPRCPSTAASCDVRFACHGGCPKDRFIETPDGEPGLNYLCQAYKTFFHHVAKPMGVMVALLDQDRAPSEIVNIKY